MFLFKLKYAFFSTTIFYSCLSIILSKKADSKNIAQIQFKFNSKHIMCLELYLKPGANIIKSNGFETLELYDLGITNSASKSAIFLEIQILQAVNLLSGRMPFVFYLSH